MNEIICAKNDYIFCKVEMSLGGLTQDVWSVIIAFTDCGSVYKALLFTCEAFHAIAVATHPRGHILFANHKLTMIRMLPDVPWNYEKIYRWVDVNWTEIESARDYRRWDWKELSLRTPFSRILAHSSLPWDWGIISRTCKITDNDVINNSTLPWDWYDLSDNKYVTHRLIEMFPEKFDHWGWEYMTHRVTDIRFIIDHPDFPWDWGEIPQKIITWDVVKNNPNLPWDWEMVCGGHGVTWENIKTIPGYVGYSAKISINPNITPEIVRANPGFPWFWPWMAENPSMTWEFFSSADYHGDMRDVTMYAPCVTYDIVVSTLRKGITWYISRLRKNPNFTWDQIMSLVHLGDFNLPMLSGDKRLTWDIVVQNPDTGWDWDKILSARNPIS